ncbi:hypothetical protein VTJ83DRAFT_1871 [Remersonia thermophila]|uniref:DNA topoisomerase (ATP-hydrolyzing) n=1 Tax=Remersonia thermophila TaxID=72144 RepID=A0ABR4DJG2_9PEZI
MSEDRCLGFVPIPSAPPSEALARIEQLLESTLDAMAHGQELVIPYRVRPQSRTSLVSSPSATRGIDGLRFPGRTTLEAERFEALFCIITMSHEALLSGNLITKRNIFYQNPDLFKSQSVVDDMVDNLAYTLGIGREDLNIVAAAKGLVCGPFDLVLRGGSIKPCDTPGDSGLLVPPLASLQGINFRDTRWLLVIEKEATFRTLAASRYAVHSQAGPGILLTAKGFPDLATRRFLSVLATIKPDLSMFALVDFDPYGVAILRTYTYGSQRLDHEENSTVPQLRWLGILSDDLLQNQSSHQGGSQGQSSHPSGQEPQFCPGDVLRSERPAKKVKINHSQNPCDSILPLTQQDRKRAVGLLRDITSNSERTDDDVRQLGGLQQMLMLNVKAEIQAVDHYGDMAAWLDRKLTEHIKA